MGRPPSITDDEILAAARAVFLDKGITATVDEVAARCHVGEATIFRRFPTKQSLFLAAMETDVEPPLLRRLPELAGYEDARVALTELASEMVAYGRKMIPLIVMKMSNPAMWNGERPATRMLRLVQGLTAFFEVHIQKGHIRSPDPRVAARIWMASLQQYVMFQTLTRTVDTLPVETFIAGLVDMFVAPTAPSAKGRRG